MPSVTEGATRIALVGASMGGTACLVAASREGQDIDAVVTLSAPTGFEGLEAGPDVLAEVEAAKLFIAGHADTAAAEAVQHALRGDPPAEASRDPHDRRPRDGHPHGEPGGDREHRDHPMARALHVSVEG